MATFQKNKSGGYSYVVQPGDDLTKIASMGGRTMAELVAQNPQFRAPVPGMATSMIHPGQTVNFNQLGVQPGAGGQGGTYTPSALASSPTGGMAQPSSTTSFTTALTSLLRDAQARHQSGSAGLMKQQQGITNTGLDMAEGISDEAMLDPTSRIGLRRGAIDSVGAGELSVENQLKLANAGFQNVNDLVEQTLGSYEKAEDRKLSASQFDREMAMKERELAAKGGSSDNPFGNANLSTGQKNDIADMLTLQKQIASLNELAGVKGGYKGAGATSGIFGGGLVTSVTGAKHQDIRNNIGQIKGFIAKLRGGTSFTENEQKLLDSYTPSISDSDSVISSKLTSLNQYINDKIESTMLVAGGSYTPSDTGLNTPEGSTDDEYNTYLQTIGQ